MNNQIPHASQLRRQVLTTVWLAAIPGGGARQIWPKVDAQALLEARNAQLMVRPGQPASSQCQGPESRHAFGETDAIARSATHQGQRVVRV